MILSKVEIDQKYFSVGLGWIAWGLMMLLFIIILDYATTKWWYHKMVVTNIKLPLNDDNTQWCYH